jgi:hypothetical protein
MFPPNFPVDQRPQYKLRRDEEDAERNKRMKPNEGEVISV